MSLYNIIKTVFVFYLT